MNNVKMLLLCVWAVLLASCGDDVYYTMQNSDDKLCEKTWVEDYEDDGAVTGAYQLRFYKKGYKGQEVSTTYTDDGKVTYDREFGWAWTDSSKETLKLTFADGRVKYFENVWVREHYLSGKIDGRVVMLRNAEYFGH